MALILPGELHTIAVRTRLGVRESGRRERWLRLFAWSGAFDRSHEPADPLDSSYGLYCECPAHAGVWRGPRARWATIDPVIPALAAAVILPWAQAMLTASEAVADGALAQAGDSWPKLSAVFEASLHVEAGQGIQLTWPCSFTLLETPDPGRTLLRLGPRSGNGSPWVSNRADTRTSWGGGDKPDWAALRASLAASYAPSLLGLIGSIEQAP